MSVPPAGAPRIAVAEVEAMRGAGWVGGGFAIFRGQPLVWTSFTFGWIVIMLGIALIPLVGPVLASFVQPVFLASFALAARRQLAGERLEMGDLFLGFRANVRSLMNLGAVILLAGIAIRALMLVVGFPVAIGAADKVLTPEDVLKALDGKWWILIAGFALSMLVSAAVWFAPALIAFHGLSTAHAIRWSVYAGLSNFGAMGVYGLALFAMYVVAIIPWGLGLLVAGPVTIASSYAAYRDVFEKSRVPAPDEHAA